MRDLKNPVFVPGFCLSKVQALFNFSMGLRPWWAVVDGLLRPARSALQKGPISGLDASHIQPIRLLSAPAVCHVFFQ